MFTNYHDYQININYEQQWFFSLRLCNIIKQKYHRKYLIMTSIFFITYYYITEFPGLTKTEQLIKLYFYVKMFHL